MALAALLSSLATAAIPANLNVPVAARVISFVQPPPSGILPVAILYQPGNAASEAEANDIVRMLSSDSSIGRASLRTRRVSVNNLASLKGTKVAFVPSGLRAHQDEISAVASPQSILTITSDDVCVQTARCVVGISNSRRTQITVSRAAAQRSRIRFQSAFLMLVKEI